MIQKPMDVPERFPVRKSRAQKEAFRHAVEAYAHSLGYETRVESGSFGVKNLVIGDSAGASYLVTAHYDTCARMLLPNLITPCNALAYIGYQTLMVTLLLAAALAVGGGTAALTKSVTIAQLVALTVYWALLLAVLIGPANPHNANDNTSGVVTLLEIAATLPENRRNRVAFVLFDLEEAGLLGSSAYRKAHRAETERQTVLNLDCVGDGDTIMLFPTKKLRRNAARLNALRPACGRFGGKSIALREKGFAVYPSDQKNFPYGVGIAALRRKRGIGLYCARIHTPRDTVLELTNVNLLRAAIITCVTGGKEP